MKITPQISNELTNTTETQSIPSKTYRLQTEKASVLVEDIEQSTVDIKIEEIDRIKGFVDGREAVRQAIYHILMTERYAYLIYDNNYGIELNQYIGQGFDYLVSTIEETLRDAILQDLRMTEVNVDNIYKYENDIALVEFTVDSIYGDLQMEVFINV